MTTTILNLLSTDRLAEHYAAGMWRDETIYGLAAAHARSAPDRPALRDRYRRLSYRAAIEAADRLAADLDRNAVRPGQRVSIWLPSRLETAIVLLACSRNGYVCCPSLHRDHTPDDVLALLERTRTAALIAQPGYGAGADHRDIFAMANALPSLRCAYPIPPLTADTKAPFAALPHGGADPDQAALSDANRVSYLAFTSGTTGVPKGVMHSDNTLLASVRAVAADWRLGPETVIYTLSPLSHNLGMGALIAAIAVGGELVIHDVARGENLLDHLVATGATYLVGVPTHAIDLLSEMRARGRSSLGKVQGFRISGAAASPDLVAALMAHGITPQSGYGMTETCSHQYTLPDDDPKLIVETSGRACAGYEIRIWRQDDPDQEAPIGEIGQIGGRGASLMLGYFDDQSATEDSFNRSGWFMTGDLGWVDERGYLRVTGRKKDLIIRGGHNIYPARIETLAMRHPAVERVAAFPVADERLGEKVCLAVMPRAGAAIDGEGMLRHLDAAGLSRFDMPEYFLAVAEIPITSSGKVLKRALVAQVAAGDLTPVPVRWRPPE